MALRPEFAAFAGTRALVIGGAGAIGSRLTRSLQEAGCAKVVVLDDFSSSFRWNVAPGPAIDLVEGDILDPRALAAVFAQSPDYVFHLAAHFANQNSVDHPEENLAVNGLGTLRVLEACRACAPRRVVVASSGCGTYGKETPIPFREETASVRLATPYQITKLLTEMYATYFHDQFGLPVSVARLFNVFGPGEVPGRYRNVIPNFVFAARQGRPLTITGTGEETRDWTYVDDAVDGFLAMCLRDAAIGESINIAGGRERTVLAMAKQVNEVTGNRAGITFVPRRDWDTKPRLLASIDKAGRILDYRPRTRFSDGIVAVNEWFSRHWDPILKSATF
jgi:UDP-glucose 4-epimerase